MEGGIVDAHPAMNIAHRWRGINAGPAGRLTDLVYQILFQMRDLGVVEVIVDTGIHGDICDKVVHQFCNSLFSVVGFYGNHSRPILWNSDGGGGGVDGAHADITAANMTAAGPNQRIRLIGNAHPMLASR